MKIVHILAPARFGGLERVVQMLAIGQKNRGHDVRVIVLLETGVPPARFVSELETHLKVMRISKPARAFAAQRRSIISIVSQINPDVVHSHGYLPDVLLASLGSRSSVSRVSTAHGFTGGGLRNRFYEWLQRLSYVRFDAVVAVSGKLANDLGAPSRIRRITVVRNAWLEDTRAMPRQSARRELGLSDDVFSVGWVGRVSPEKGPDVIVEAMGLLKDLNIRLSVIGDGALRSTLENRARQLGIDDLISWHGEVTVASGFFRAFDTFVNSSRTEGTPITLFEAMNAGVPVIATAVGGVPDVVSPEEALLIPPEDPAALASAIREVRGNPDVAAQRALRARSRMEKDFSFASWLDSYDDVYAKARARPR